MRDGPTPEDQGRSHALRSMVDKAEILATQPQADHPDLSDEDRRYLRSFVATCRSIADRLRRSPGFEA